MWRATFWSTLLASTTLSCAAFAQVNNASTAGAPTSASASAADTQTEAAGLHTRSETINVTGKGATRDGVTGRSPGGGLMVNDLGVKMRQTLTRDYIAKQGPTTNPEQLLAMEPGANVSMGDPFGLSIGHMTIRGLDISEIGWLFEGMPFNNGAVYPNEIVDSENLSTISMTPGAVDFDQPTFGAAAGLVELRFRDPTQKPGGYINLAGGSYHYDNEFLRLDSGEIGQTGVRGFFSFSHTFADAWHGPGYDYRHHIDSKFVKDFSNGSQSAFSVAYNHQIFMLDRWPTLAQWNQYGRSFTYTDSFMRGSTNYWGLHQSAFDNVAVSAPNRIVLTPHLELDAMPYFFHGGGTSPGGTVLTQTGTYSGSERVSFLPLPLSGDTGSTPNSAVLYSPTLYDQFRTGFTTDLNYHTGPHTITAGYWYEYDNATTTGALDPISQTGMPTSIWGSQGLITLPNDSRYESSHTITQAQISGPFIGDRASFMDNRLEIDGGFKEILYRQDGWNTIPGTDYHRDVNYSIPQPEIGARYSLDSNNMVYVNVGTNYLTPQSSQLFDVISDTTGKITQTGGTALKPEYSIVEEIGYRYQGKLLNASAAFFNYNFTNRQISTSVEQNSALVTEYIDAGGQTTRGVDGQIGLRPWHHFRPYISGEYLHATIDNDIMAPDRDLLPTAGKTAVRSPHYLGALGIDYDTGRFFANVDLHYTSSQYSTFMNDQKIPGFGTANATIGYRFHDMWHAKTPTIQLNLVNINDNRYLAGVYSVQNNAVATRGVYGTNIAASGSPTYLAGAGFAAIISVASSF